MYNLRYATPQIAVIGDIMIDHYIWGKCERISPEAPVQIVEIEKENLILGGAGNVVNNLKILNAKVFLYTVVGDDQEADDIKNLLNKIGVDEDNILREKGRLTTKKSRVMASSQQIVRLDNETREDISQATQKELLDKFASKISSYDVILLSDYAKGILTASLIQQVINLAKKFNKPVLVDPKGSDYGKYTGATLLTPNKKEASRATNIDIVDAPSLKKAGFKLKNELGLQYGIITLSEDGIAIFDKDMEIVPTVSREVFDVTGAGDTVLAALGVAVSSGIDIQEACKFANSAAAVVVAKVGAATVSFEEIEAYHHSLGNTVTDNKIKNFTQIKHISDRLRLQDKKIVFTNGCFDILHTGHAKYLQEAKSYGDVLIIGLNSDASVSRLKGASRPINMEDDRAYVLASLEAVDYVVIFDDDTPYELIKTLQPHVLVKGGDYKGKKIIGEDIADELKLVDFVDGKSTTNIIEKIKGREVEE